MRRILIQLGLGLIPLACGFDEVPAPGAPAGSSAGSGSTPSGAAGTSSGPLPGSAGTPSTAGPGSAGSSNGGASAGGNPQGGSTAQAGSSSAGGSANGTSGSAGSNGTGGSNGSAGSSGTGGGSAVSGPFTLLWRDDFDSFDSNRWAKATHTFDENLARFVADNAVVEGGMLKLRVTKVPQGGKQYSAAEVYTKQEFTFGRFEGRIKFCPGSGMVSSLFTYKDDVDVSWQEIDIEHLGYLPKSVQYNLVSGSLNARKYQPKVVSFDYSPTAEFHDYAIEWTPDAIKFFVDGAQTYQDAQASIKDAARLRMNTWPANYAVTTFAGQLDTSAIPCESQYDWVQVYSYTP